MQALPPELLMDVFELLDKKSLLSCMYTCRKARMVGQRVLFACPRLYSRDVMEAFIRALFTHQDLAHGVIHLHILGKQDYSSTRDCGWVVDIPRRLGPLLPNVRSITFENIENVMLAQDFWNNMEVFDKVTTLHIKNCRMFNSNNVRSMVYTFPGLTSLTLEHVSWSRIVHKCEGKPISWERLLSLRRLAMKNMDDIGCFKDIFKWFNITATLSHLELSHIPPAVFPEVSDFLKRLAAAHIYLTSFEFHPLIMHGSAVDFLWPVVEAISLHRTLSVLSLHIAEVNDAPLRWVPNLLGGARSLPIKEVSLGFTLDAYKASSQSHAWMDIHARLSSYWPKTLQKVVLTHHPVAGFIDHRTVPGILAKWFNTLDERGLLEIRLGELYPDV